MSTKPTTVPRWANVGGALITPSSAKQDVGWLTGERPPAQYSNYLHKWLGDWCQYVSDGDLTLNTVAIQPATALTALALRTPNESASVPQLKAQDWSGNARATHDHLGYRGGQLSEWEEHWKVAGTAAQLGWTYTVGASATLTSKDPNTNWNHRYNEAVLPAAGTPSFVANTETIAYMDANLAFVMEWMVRTPAAITVASGNIVNWGIRFDNGGLQNSYFQFRHTGANANWRCARVVAGAVSSDLDSGVAVATNTKYRMRLEIIGSALYSGGGGNFFARWFLNGALVQSLAFTSPAADKFALYFQGSQATAGTAYTWETGRIRAVWNHLQTQDNL